MQVVGAVALKAEGVLSHEEAMAALTQAVAHGLLPVSPEQLQQLRSSMCSTVAQRGWKVRTLVDKWVASASASRAEAWMRRLDVEPTHGS